jgi:predicted RNA-binding protein
MLSNAGVIPREFEDMYPFNSYDWGESEETPQIKKRYIEVTGERIRNYLMAHGNRYKSVSCFLKYDSESYIALKAACDDLGVGFKNLLAEETYDRIKGDPRPMQSDAALGDLREGLKWCLQNST